MEAVFRAVLRVRRHAIERVFAVADGSVFHFMQRAIDGFHGAQHEGGIAVGRNPRDREHIGEQRAFEGVAALVVLHRG